jgi:hypothetical protein
MWIITIYDVVNYPKTILSFLRTDLNVFPDLIA